MSGRPMPDDFAAMTKRLTRAELRKHYGIGSVTLAIWLEEAGAPADRRLRPMPDDFRDQYAKLSLEALANHYWTHGDTVRRWVRQLGPERDALRAAKLATIPKRAMPEGFAAAAMKMTRTQAVEHYRTSTKVIRRWEEECGVRCRAYTPTFRKDNRPPIERAAAMAVARVSTVHDIAADTLRRERWVVYRCDPKGNANIAGSHWRVGNVVCDDDELLARAARAERRAA